MGETTHALGSRPSANNGAGVTSVLQNLLPISKERTQLPGEQLSSVLSGSHCPDNSNSGFTIIERLGKLLSSSRSSAFNDVASVDDLISLYKTASKWSLLRHLSAEQMTEVLSICGTLSLPSPRSSSVYDSHLVPFFQPPSANVSYWTFILQAAKDKERLSHKLTLQDRYWVMRACLARISHVDGGRNRPGKNLMAADF